MAAPLLTTGSMLTCPHGGRVTIAPGNPRVQAGGLPIATLSDTFTVIGCPFQIPVGPAMVPHPCVTVQWMRPCVATTAHSPAIAADSAGLCLAADLVPQGPVVIALAQPHVAGR